MDEIRYFIITPGRTGSSVLCAILADAGAQFGVPSPVSWKHDEGALEHPLTIRAYRLLSRIERLRAAPPGVMHRIRLKAAGRNFHKTVSALLRVATYVKVGDGAFIPKAVELGYRPRFILSTRRYEECAASLLRLHAPRHTPTEIREMYRRAFTEGSMLASVHGGVVVDYDDLLGSGDWIERISRLAPLSADRLSMVSEKRVRKDSRPLCRVPEDPEMSRLYEAARQGHFGRPDLHVVRRK